MSEKYVFNTCSKCNRKGHHVEQRCPKNIVILETAIRHSKKESVLVIGEYEMSIEFMNMNDGSPAINVQINKEGKKIFQKCHKNTRENIRQ